MAKQIITKILDDLDGGEADETVHFAIDGIAYEIDLSTRNAATLRDFMAPYQEAGTRNGRVGQQAQMRSYRQPQISGMSTAEARELNQTIRLWAADNGYTTLADRGRIPQHVVDAYNSNTPHPDKTAAERAAAVAAEVKEQPARPAKRTTAPRKAAFSAAGT